MWLWETWSDPAAAEGRTGSCMGCATPWMRPLRYLTIYHGSSLKRRTRGTQAVLTVLLVSDLSDQQVLLVRPLLKATIIEAGCRVAAWTMEKRKRGEQSTSTSKAPRGDVADTTVTIVFEVRCGIVRLTFYHL